jgi:hypothetical protein
MHSQDRYILLTWGIGEYRIVHDDANSFVGGASLLHGRFVVTTEDSEEIDIVNSLDEVIPAIAAYYEANPPRWILDRDGIFWHTDVKACGPRYIKNSAFGPLIVFEIAPKQWVAYRNQCELLHNSKMAIFASRGEAQRKADVHERDGYPNSVSIDDGYSWTFSEEEDWTKEPVIVANRARLMVQTNTSTLRQSLTPPAQRSTDRHFRAC